MEELPSLSRQVTVRLTEQDWRDLRVWGHRRGLNLAQVLRLSALEALRASEGS